MSEKKSFVLYCDYAQHIALLADDEKGRLLTAIFEYANTGTYPEMSGPEKIAFSFIRAQMERDSDKWEETRQKRVEAGRKGGKAKGIAGKQNKAKKANAIFAKQTLANGKQTLANETVNVTDNVTVTVNVNDTLSKDNGGQPPNSESIPYQKIIDLFNSICTDLPKVKRLTDARRESIEEGFQEGYSLSDFEALFGMAQSSPFLTGKVKDFRAGFDWLISPANMPKVLEGTYQQGGPQEQQNSTTNRYGKNYDEPWE